MIIRGLGVPASHTVQGGFKFFGLCQFQMVEMDDSAGKETHYVLMGKKFLVLVFTHMKQHVITLTASFLHHIHPSNTRLRTSMNRYHAWSTICRPGQEFGIRSVLVSICSASSVDRSRVSRLWLRAGRQSMWRAEEAGSIGWNAVLEPIDYCLMELLISFFKNVSTFLSRYMFIEIAKTLTYCGVWKSSCYSDCK